MFKAFGTVQGKVLEVKLVGCFGGDGTVTGKRTADYCQIKLRYILMRTINL